MLCKNLINGIYNLKNGLSNLFGCQLSWNVYEFPRIWLLDYVQVLAQTSLFTTEKRSLEEVAWPVLSLAGYDTTLSCVALTVCCFPAIGKLTGFWIIRAAVQSSLCNVDPAKNLLFSWAVRMSHETLLLLRTI